MDEVTAVVVSYQQDLTKLSTCINSILTHGKCLKKIIIVVNDTVESVPLFKNLATDSRIQVIHHTEVAEWNFGLDWWSQQYFKLAISQQVSTPWYLLLDSDDVLIADLNKKSLFNFFGRARCLDEDRKVIDHSENPYLLSWLKRALSVFGILQLPSWTMGNLTPFMMHTKTAQKVYDSTPIECFDIRNGDLLTLEFYLYYAYLVQQNLFKKLYTPVKSLSYALDKRNQ